MLQMASSREFFLFLTGLILCSGAIAEDPAPKDPEPDLNCIFENDTTCKNWTYEDEWQTDPGRGIKAEGAGNYKLPYEIDTNITTVNFRANISFTYRISNDSDVKVKVNETEDLKFSFGWIIFNTSQDIYNSRKLLIEFILTNKSILMIRDIEVIAEKIPEEGKGKVDEEADEQEGGNEAADKQVVCSGIYNCSADMSGFTLYDELPKVYVTTGKHRLISTNVNGDYEISIKYFMDGASSTNGSITISLLMNEKDPVNLFSVNTKVNYWRYLNFHPGDFISPDNDYSIIIEAVASEEEDDSVFISFEEIKSNPIKQKGIENFFNTCDLDNVTLCKGWNLYYFYDGPCSQNKSDIGCYGLQGGKFKLQGEDTVAELHSSWYNLSEPTMMEIQIQKSDAGIAVLEAFIVDPNGNKNSFIQYQIQGGNSSFVIDVPRKKSEVSQLVIKGSVKEKATLELVSLSVACDPNPCLNEAQCFRNGINFECKCKSDYIGALCDQKKFNVSKSNSNAVIVGVVLGCFLLLTCIISFVSIRNLKRQLNEQSMGINSGGPRSYGNLGYE